MRALGEELDGLAHQRGIAGRPRLGAIVTLDPVDLLLFDFAGKDVAGQVEIDRPALAVERLAEGDADVLRDAIAEVDAVGRS